MEHPSPPDPIEPQVLLSDFPLIAIPSLRTGECHLRYFRIRHSKKRS
jgi:hypothetical protein